MSKVHVTLVALVVFACSFMLLPGVSLAGGPIEPPAEIPEHPQPGKALAPGFETPEPPFEERILWKDHDHSAALFIPQLILDEHSLTTLPITEKDREVLKGKIQMSKPIEGPLPHPLWKPMPKCSWPRHGGPSEPWPEAVPMAQLLQEDTAVFIGEAVAVVEGWDTQLRYVSTATYYRVEEIVLDPENRLREGGVLGTHSVGGEITIDGIEVCSYHSKGFYQPAVGDRVLLSGEYGTTDEFFQAVFRFPIVEDKILPQPIGRLLEREPVSLAVTKEIVREADRDR